MPLVKIGDKNILNFVSDWQKLFSNIVYSSFNISFDDKETTFNKTWNTLMLFFRDPKSKDFINNIDIFKQIYDELEEIMQETSCKTKLKQ